MDSYNDLIKYEIPASAGPFIDSLRARLRIKLSPICSHRLIDYNEKWFAHAVKGTNSYFKGSEKYKKMGIIAPQAVDSPKPHYNLFHVHRKKHRIRANKYKCSFIGYLYAK